MVSGDYYANVSSFLSIGDSKIYIFEHLQGYGKKSNTDLINARMSNVTIWPTL